VAAARQAAAAAGRCYWVAHTYLAGDKWAEAAALFGRAGERIKDAQDKLGDLPKSEEAARTALPGLASLLGAAKAYQLVAVAEDQAEGASGQEQARKGLGGMKLAPGAQQQQAGQAATFLADDLQAWESFAGQGGKGVRIYSAPYGFQSVPARPIMLDTAAYEVHYPDVGHRFKRAAVQTQSTFAKLFGGWGRT